MITDQAHTRVSSAQACLRVNLWPGGETIARYLKREEKVNSFIIWLAVSVQDKRNPALIEIDDYPGKLSPSCHLGIIRLVPQENQVMFFFSYNKSFIDQACSVKMAVYWHYGPRL